MIGSALFGRWAIRSCPCLVPGCGKEGRRVDGWYPTDSSTGDRRDAAQLSVLSAYSIWGRWMLSRGSGGEFQMGCNEVWRFGKRVICRFQRQNEVGEDNEGMAGFKKQISILFLQVEDWWQSEGWCETKVSWGQREAVSPQQEDGERFYLKSQQQKTLMRVANNRSASVQSKTSV